MGPRKVKVNRDGEEGRNDVLLYSLTKCCAQDAELSMLHVVYTKIYTSVVNSRRLNRNTLRLRRLFNLFSRHT